MQAAAAGAPGRGRLVALAVLLVAAAALAIPMREALLNSLLYFPFPTLIETPAAAGLAFSDVEFATDDGERLHGWWVPARARPGLGHVLLFHGNAGNVAGRVLHARLLSDAGLDVFLFDYRGYGRSSGRPGEQGTYRDARAARAALLGQAGVDPARVVYLGESLGGAVALALALEQPPRGLVLQSTFTSVRDMARLHYPVVPAALVPDAYPSLRRIPGLACPLLVLHGDRDDIVPASHGKALFDAAPGPKRLHVVAGAGHNDFLDVMGRDYGAVIAGWAEGLPARRRSEG
jgi:fermentation-respiration switch protein FrsA (DUF1100 family)